MNRPARTSRPMNRPERSDRPDRSDRPSFRSERGGRPTNRPAFGARPMNRPARAEAPELEMIFGIRPIMEAIEAGKEIDKVLISKDLSGELSKELKVLLREKEIPSQLVPVEKLNRVTRKNHQGILAFISPIEYARLDEIVASTFEKGEVPLILILDQVTDVRNFGAIVRTAECAGAHAVVIPSRGAAQINGDALKTSAGALHLVPVCRVNHLFQAVRFLQESGIQVIAASEKTTKSMYEADLKVPTAFIMGSEDEGIEADLIDQADDACMIPLHGKIQSLNVSVAASLMLYEAVRQRQNL